MRRRIYIATSWKLADEAIQMTKDLRAVGHEVDCFCDDSAGRFVFSFTEIENYENLNAIEFLKYDKPQKAYMEDKKGLDWADTVILILPSGKSAHLEAGYARGQDKELYIYGDFPKGEFDVMYGFANKMFKKEQRQELYDCLLGSVPYQTSALDAMCEAHLAEDA